MLGILLKIFLLSKFTQKKHLVEETKYTNKKVNIFNNIPSISNLDNGGIDSNKKSP